MIDVRHYFQIWIPVKHSWWAESSDSPKNTRTRGAFCRWIENNIKKLKMLGTRGLWENQKSQQRTTNNGEVSKKNSCTLQAATLQIKQPPPLTTWKILLSRSESTNIKPLETFGMTRLITSSISVIISCSISRSEWSLQFSYYSFITFFKNCIHFHTSIMITCSEIK